LTDVLKQAEEICEKARKFREEGALTVILPPGSYQALGNRMKLAGEYEKILPELTAYARGLEAALIDTRAQYLLWLDENPDGQAWDFDELTNEEQDRYRRDAIEGLKWEEPWISIQLREARNEIDRVRSTG